MAQINRKSETGKRLVCIKPEIYRENASETARAAPHRNPGHKGSGPGRNARQIMKPAVGLNLQPQGSFQGQVCSTLGIPCLCRASNTLQRQGEV